MWVKGSNSSGSSGLTEAFHQQIATVGAAGWNTGCKLSDAKVIIAYSDSVARMFHAVNNNGVLDLLREMNNNDTTLTVDGDGYLVFSSTNATVRNAAASIYGYI